MSEKAPIIEVSHLVKDYGHHRGVFDVSFSVHEGECFGYLGPNGAGKSTTIRHIMGFSKPSSGSIKVFGKEAFRNTSEILAKVGYLPGEPSLPKGLNGTGFLKMMAGMRGKEHSPRTEELLQRFALDPSPNITSMSLGDKRKLAIVAAFMDDPDVLILDEPTSGLDPIMQQVFISFVIEEKKKGKTILLSSHIFSEVDATADIISIIRDGIHVSTFKAKDFQNRDNVAYHVRFLDEASMMNFIQDPAPCQVERYHHLTCDVRMNIKDLHDGFEKLSRFRVKEFEEKPFTLQDYFMSFYKEEKTFGGLEGIAEVKQ